MNSVLRERTQKAYRVGRPFQAVLCVSRPETAWKGRLTGNISPYAVGVSLITVHGILRLIRFSSEVNTRPGPIS